ncbi:MAG: penicillin acylase family protein [Acidobacteriaceae bacterium]
MSAFSPRSPETSYLRRQRSRWLLVGLLVLLSIVVLLCVGGTFWLRRAMRASLPQLDGQLNVAGLSHPVTVRRDAHGVPHISAANMDDLIVAQGYVTAQDRMWQMDMLRRYASGDLAEILGPKAVKHDRAQRILEIGHAADAALAAMDPADRRFLEDYARGVNAYIAQAESQGHNRLPAEFRLLDYRPQPWRPRDSLLAALNMVETLSMDAPTKLAREKIEARLKSPALVADLYPVGSWRDHPPVSTLPPITAPQTVPRIPLDSSQTGIQKNVEDILQLEKLLPSSPIMNCRACAAGSNNWTVSGAHTVTGLPLLSNDMHLDHTIPDTWYEAQLTSGNFDVAGVTLPGVPFVIVGHNAKIAWGFTLLYADVQDIYVEQTDGDRYKTPEGWKPFQHDHEVIHVRGGFDDKLDVLRTDHGPVITPLLPHEKRTLALRWTVYDPATVTLPFYQIDSAQNWDEFRAALALFGGPPQNAVYADAQGNIGYQATGKIPLRPNGLVGVPIADGSHEWQGYIPFDKLPSAYNPPQGILATANSRVTPDGYPYPITLEWAAPYRNERIWKVLESKPKLSASDMLALQNDVYSAFDQELAQRFTYAIDHANHPNPRLRQAAHLMRTWDGNVTIPSAAANIVDAARDALWPMLLKPRLGEEWKLYRWASSTFALEQIVSGEPQRWLPARYSNWNDFLAAAVDRGMTVLHAPPDLRSWQYGKTHPVEVEHPLYGSIPWMRSWTGTGAHPQSGDGTTVKQVSRVFGPSERLTVDFSDLDRSTLNIVIGQSGDPLSPYYMDQWPYWYAGKTFALPFSDSAVQSAAAHTLTLVP